MADFTLLEHRINHSDVGNMPAPEAFPSIARKRMYATAETEGGQSRTTSVTARPDVSSHPPCTT